MDLNKHIQLAEKHGQSRLAMLELKDGFGNKSVLDVFVDHSGWVFCKLGVEALSNLRSDRLCMHVKDYTCMSDIIDDVSSWVEAGSRTIVGKHTT